MKRIFWLLLGLSIALGAKAEIYKHVDADGRVTYSNVPMKGAVKLSIQPPPPSSSAADGKAAKGAPSPDDIRKLEQEKQKQLVAERRAMLEDELAKERQALEEAKAMYAEAEKDPEVFFHVVGEDEKPILGAKEGRPVVGAGDTPIIVDANGKPVLGSDNKPVPARVDVNGKPLPYIIGADGKPVMGKDGKPAPFQKKRGRNMAWYAEKLNLLQEEIKNHENNIEVLEQELSRL